MQQNVSISPRENSFLTKVSSLGKNIFSFAEAQSFWGSPHYAKVALHRLVRKRMLIQLERGKYLVVPLEAGSERKWTEDSFLIANALVQPAVIAYWTAVRHWNWTEQIPRIVYVQTTARKRRPKRTVIGVPYEFVTIPSHKFFGHAREWIDGKPVLVTDKERTLLDCADDVARAGSIEELVKAATSAAPEISWERLDGYARRFPNGAALKRLGFLFENLGLQLSEPAKAVLESWCPRLTAGIAALQPSGRRTGKIVSRWRVRVNAQFS